MTTTPPKGYAVAPKELWLQLHGDCDESELDEPVDCTAGDVTWCWHEIHTTDIRYVRADLAGVPPTHQPEPWPEGWDGRDKAAFQRAVGSEEAWRQWGKDFAADGVPDHIEATCKTPLQVADGVTVPAEIDRDTDGELLIDWSPATGRMVTLSLRADGRLSYAITWDGEQSHGTAQMPAGVRVGSNPQSLRSREAGQLAWDALADGVAADPEWEHYPMEGIGMVRRRRDAK